MANKRGAGAPTKEVRIRNKINRMEASLKEDILTGKQKIVDNYLKYLDVLHDSAMGNLKNCSPTNQISCAKILIEKAEEILEEQKVNKTEADEVPVTPVKQEKQTSNLINFK